MFDEVTSFPKSWEFVSLGDVIELKYGKSLTKSNRHGGNYPVYGSNGIIGFHSNFIVENHCLVVGRKGSIGEIHISENSCYPIDTTYYIDEFYEQPVNYWLYRLKALPLGQLNRASAVPGLNREDAYKIQIPLPPLNEQRRIVAKIEALKARSQWVKEAIAAIPPLLDQFRQSVLAAAFRGDLTADWREKNPDVEPASVLLERIRRECQQNKAKNKKLEEIHITNLPELPKSWCWTSLGEVSAIQGGIQKQPKRVPNKNAYPFLRVANVPRGGLNLDNVHQIELFGNELEKLRLYKGDLLIVEGNGSPSEIGRMAIWDGSIKDCVHQNHLIRVRLDEGLMPEFVEAYWNSPQGRFRVFDVAHTTTGLYTLSVSKIAKLPVPFAPEAEQVVLMQILKKLFKIETYVQAIIMQSKDELDSLDQSILAKAFRGELVPQDPNDEPASMLLERIKAERGKREAQAKAAKNTDKTSGRRSRKAQQPDSESTQLELPGLE